MIRLLIEALSNMESTECKWRLSLKNVNVNDKHAPFFCHLRVSASSENVLQQLALLVNDKVQLHVTDIYIGITLYGFSDKLLSKGSILLGINS